ncbi:hypothetical protein ES756_17770 [Salmonella enterica]|nr:hypothetical protein [Salmonella enterica]
MNVNTEGNGQTPLLPPGRLGEEKPVAEIVEFNAYGNKPRCLICLGITASATGVLGGVCSAVVASVSSGAAYNTALTVLGASIGVAGIGMMGICTGLYLGANAIRTYPAYP